MHALHATFSRLARTVALQPLFQQDVCDENCKNFKVEVGSDLPVGIATAKLNLRANTLIKSHMKCHNTLAVHAWKSLPPQPC